MSEKPKTDIVLRVEDCGGGTPKSPAATPKRSSFFESLVAAAASSGPALSPMETRLITIASQLMANMVVMVRCADPNRGTPLPLCPQVVEEAAKLALVGAAEMEAQLHRMRDATAREQA